MPYTSLEEALEKFEQLQWPMSLLSTGVDMEIMERDKQVEKFIRGVWRSAQAARDREIVEGMKKLKKGLHGGTENDEEFPCDECRIVDTLVALLLTKSPKEKHEE